MMGAHSIRGRANERIPRSSAIYKNIASSVSVLRCEDSAFQMLLETLREWFPVESER